MSSWPLIIHGSCVSRDLVPYLPVPVKLMRYVARQSLVSATTPPWEPPAPVKLDSRFQTRMVEQDLRSQGLKLLATLPTPPKLMLMDLIDERLGLLRLSDTQFATFSFEFRNVPGLCVPADARVIPFGTDEHWELFQRAVEKYLEFLKSSGLFPKVRLLRTPFATHTVDDTEISPFMGRSGEEWDELYEPYYDLLTSSGLTTVTLARDDAASDTAHQWGPAPYHYSEPTSRALASALMATMVEDSQRREIRSL